MSFLSRVSNSNTFSLMFKLTIGSLISLASGLTSTTAPPSLWFSSTMITVMAGLFVTRLVWVCHLPTNADCGIPRARVVRRMTGASDGEISRHSRTGIVPKDQCDCGLVRRATSTKVESCYKILPLGIQRFQSLLTGAGAECQLLKPNPLPRPYRPAITRIPIFSATRSNASIAKPGSAPGAPIRSRLQATIFCARSPVKA
jgi:hypothetical protein